MQQLDEERLHLRLERASLLGDSLELQLESGLLIGELGVEAHAPCRRVLLGFALDAGDLGPRPLTDRRDVVVGAAPGLSGGRLGLHAGSVDVAGDVRLALGQGCVTRLVGRLAHRPRQVGEELRRALVERRCCLGREARRLLGRTSGFAAIHDRGPGRRGPARGAFGRLAVGPGWIGSGPDAPDQVVVRPGGRLVGRGRRKLRHALGVRSRLPWEAKSGPGVRGGHGGPRGRISVVQESSKA